MKIQLHISPEMAARIKADADQFKISQSQAVRNRLAAIYGLPSCTPRQRNWAPDPLQVHDDIPKGANL